jgi:(E)-4-hydroxy-3-methylbut-2-enyl-diphosphate synthase
MQSYCNSLTTYHRLQTLEVKVGDLLLGNGHPIRIQTMTTTDTMDTLATVEQSIRCIQAGAELGEDHCAFQKRSGEPSAYQK